MHVKIIRSLFGSLVCGAFWLPGRHQEPYSAAEAQDSVAEGSCLCFHLCVCGNIFRVCPASASRFSHRVFLIIPLSNSVKQVNIN